MIWGYPHDLGNTPQIYDALNADHLNSETLGSPNYWLVESGVPSA